jgi:hypothetical protein
MLSNKKTLEFLRELETLLKNTFEFDDVKIIVECDMDKLLDDGVDDDDEILHTDTDRAPGGSQD